MLEFKVSVNTQGKISLTFDAKKIEISSSHPGYEAVKTAVEQWYIDFPPLGQKYSGMIDVNGDGDWITSFIKAIKKVKKFEPSSGNELFEILSTAELDNSLYNIQSLCNIGSKIPTKIADSPKGTLLYTSKGYEHVRVAIANGNGGSDIFDIKEHYICKKIESCLYKTLGLTYSDKAITPSDLQQTTGARRRAATYLLDTIKNLALSTNKREKRLSLVTLEVISARIDNDLSYTEVLDDQDAKKILILYVNQAEITNSRIYYDEEMDGLTHALMIKKQIAGHTVHREDIHNLSYMKGIISLISKKNLLFDQICFVGHSQTHSIPILPKPLNIENEVLPSNERHAGGFSYAAFGKFCYKIQKLTQAKELKFFMCEVGVDPGQEKSPGDGLSNNVLLKLKQIKDKHFVVTAETLRTIKNRIINDPTSVNSISGMNLILTEMYKEMLYNGNGSQKPLIFRATAPNGQMLYTEETGFTWDAFDISQYPIASDADCSLSEIQRDARKTRVQYHVNI